MENTAPGFLIAMPNLRDPNFAETVVLMLEHNSDGAVGLVVNRPFPGDPNVVCSGLGIEWPVDGLGDIRLGGPVRTQAGCIVHPAGVAFADTQAVTNGLSVSTSREALESLSQRSDCPFRLMLGYAGWGSGQLELEMTQGTWLLAPVTESVVFDTPAHEMYDRALASLGIARHHLSLANTAVN